jgi:hypothetical protein
MEPLKSFKDYFSDERGKQRIEALDLKFGYSVKAECLIVPGYHGDDKPLEKWSTMILTYDGSIVGGPIVCYSKKEAEKCVKHCAGLIEEDKAEEAIEHMESLKNIHQVPDNNLTAEDEELTKPKEIDRPKEVKMDMRINKFKQEKKSVPSKNKYDKK